MIVRDHHPGGTPTGGRGRLAGSELGGVITHKGEDLCVAGCRFTACAQRPEVDALPLAALTELRRRRFGQRRERDGLRDPLPVGALVAEGVGGGLRPARLAGREHLADVADAGRRWRPGRCGRLVRGGRDQFEGRHFLQASLSRSSWLEGLRLEDGRAITGVGFFQRAWVGLCS